MVEAASVTNKTKLQLLAGIKEIRVSSLCQESKAISVLNRTKELFLDGIKETMVSSWCQELRAVSLDQVNKQSLEVFTDSLKVTRQPLT
jgi:hypothetical protein